MDQEMIKLLSDKKFDKRYQGGQQLKSVVQCIAEQNNEQSIKILIDDIKSKFLITSQIELKRAGTFAFICIAEVIKQNFPMMAEKIVVFLLDCLFGQFSDVEAKTRTLVIECINSLAKIFQEIILIAFGTIFKTAFLRTQEENEVSNAIQILDKTLQEILTVNIQQHKQNPEKKLYFDIAVFFTNFEKENNLRSQKDANIKDKIYNWIVILNKQYDENLYKYFPFFLEQLFYLTSDYNLKGKAIDFLEQLSNQIKLFCNEDQQINEAIIDVLIKICNIHKQNINKFEILSWFYKYLEACNCQLEINQLSSRSPTKSNELSCNNNFAINVQINMQTPLIKSILNKFGDIVIENLKFLYHQSKEMKQFALEINNIMLIQIDKFKNQYVKLDALVNIINDKIQENTDKNEYALIWMKKLLEIFPEKLSASVNDIVDNLLKKLEDYESMTIQQIIDVLVCISSQKKHFVNIIELLLKYFNKHQIVFEKIGKLLFSKFCQVQEAKDVYFTITDKLLNLNQNKDLNFISIVVQHLTTLLIQDQSLKKLRNVLKNLKLEKNALQRSTNQEIFQTLFKTFCYSPMSALTLCLLSEEYKLGYNIIISFSENEVDYLILNDIAKLIKVLELPAFVFLRLQILEYQYHPYLAECLFGLLMLLPQGNEFNILQQRLSNIKSNSNISLKNIEPDDFLDSAKLLDVYKSIRKECLNINQKDQQ